ncbi:hypothetical protein PSI15_09230 [Xenorhabdus sp. PR6a]|uniref:hypothetical protein n=1 Tax=Xenorhabdus sp. PR6a TaxID=3025877 RepID=UPI0023588D08|nr:hypothetical protein [Xenorhabdus sp. PR6a]MDC9581745.1 hypothetical protein [Xenorhabdus sp. PR6a]
MTKDNIEELMQESGFTAKEIKSLTSINKKYNTTLLDEMINLESRFYRLVFVIPLSFLVLAFFFLIAGEANIIGFVISVIILMPPALFMLSFRLSYRAFIFMRRYKNE